MALGRIDKGLIFGASTLLAGCVVSTPVRNFTTAYSDKAKFFQDTLHQSDIVVKPALLQNQDIGNVQFHNSSLVSNKCRLNLKTDTENLIDSGPQEWSYGISGYLLNPERARISPVGSF